MLRLYDFPLSGNCYKVRLALHQLDVPYERVEIDLLSSAGRPPALAQVDPAGRLPLVRLDDGRWLAESNAILWFLAEGTPLLPDGPAERFEVLRWLLFEQNAIEPNIGAARLWHGVAKSREPHGGALPLKQLAGREALEVLERLLASRPYVAGNSYTIADIATFAYTHCAHEGGIDASGLNAFGAWLGRVRATPRFVPLEYEGPEPIDDPAFQNSV